MISIYIKDQNILVTKREMNNPWEEIKLDDYEKHMSLDSVKQLQTINKMMKEQFDA